jgi:hypothetical protein
MTASERPGDIPKRATRVKDLYQQLKLWSAGALACGFLPAEPHREEGH